MNNIDFQIENLIVARKSIHNMVKDVSKDALFIIPKKYKTNLIWNLGHLVTTQQILMYKLSSVPLLIDRETLSYFRKGSDPVTWEKTPDHKQILNLLEELPVQFKKDYHNGVFTGFKEYETSSGLVLSNVNDAISYNNYHEGLHQGIISSLLKEV